MTNHAFDMAIYVAPPTEAVSVRSELARTERSQCQRAAGQSEGETASGTRSNSEGEGEMNEPGAAAAPQVSSAGSYISRSPQQRALDSALGGEDQVRMELVIAHRRQVFHETQAHNEAMRAVMEAQNRRWPAELTQARDVMIAQAVTIRRQQIAMFILIAIVFLLICSWYECARG